jgi:hypothetical protein
MVDQISVNLRRSNSRVTDKLVSRFPEFRPDPRHAGNAPTLPTPGGMLWTGWDLNVRFLSWWLMAARSRVVVFSPPSSGRPRGGRGTRSRRNARSASGAENEIFSKSPVSVLLSPQVFNPCARDNRAFHRSRRSSPFWPTSQGLLRGLRWPEFQ